MRVFLDANILFSAAQPHSRMRAFFSVLAAHVECVTSPYAVEEARRNLELKLPHALSYLPNLVKRCRLVFPVARNLDVKLKAKDLPILGGAVAAEATHLLTGDRQDFGPLFGATIAGVRIVSPKMLAEELKNLGWL